MAIQMAVLAHINLLTGKDSHYTYQHPRESSKVDFEHIKLSCKLLKDMTGKEWYWLYACKVMKVRIITLYI